MNDQHPWWLFLIIPLLAPVIIVVDLYAAAKYLAGLRPVRFVEYV